MLSWKQLEQLERFDSAGAGGTDGALAPNGWVSVSPGARAHLALEVQPDIAALAELVDDYERLAVALVSRTENSRTTPIKSNAV
jgi:hypothetical protein